MGWLTHYHGWLNHCSHGWAAWPSHLGMRLPSVHAPKPSSWPRVNGPAASITTSKVAASLPWRASSTAYSSAWSWQASSSSILAGGGYSTCMAGTLPWALELMARPGHLVTSTTRPNASHCQLSCWWCRCLFRHRISSGGRLPHVHLFVCLFYIFLHWPLHGPPLLLHLRHILAWS